MYDEVMRRPMFQTPQQRQASGIMAGVAPVRGYAGGGFLGEGSDLGDKLREGRDYALDVGSNIQDNYEEFLSTEDDDEVINVRDFTNIDENKSRAPSVPFPVSAVSATPNNFSSVIS